MNLPDIIYAELSCNNCNNSNNLMDIIIQIKIKAGNKNPYFIYFPKTDAFGKTFLKKEDLIGQFQDHWEMALMDYNGSLETASSKIEVNLFDPTWFIKNKKLAMAYPLLKNELNKWINREQQYEYMITCRNLQFNCKSIVIDLNKTDHIVLKVTYHL